MGVSLMTQQSLEDAIDKVHHLADGVVDEPNQLVQRTGEVELVPVGATLVAVEEAVEAELFEGLVQDAVQVAQEVLDGRLSQVDVEAVDAREACVLAVLVFGV